jgi:hypothetical protein
MADIEAAVGYDCVVADDKKMWRAGPARWNTSRVALSLGRMPRSPLLAVA